MLIKSLDLTNFKQYRQQSIRFNEGLTGLVGLNGAGKSTVFDAITFALYGSTGDANLKDLKNDHAASSESVHAVLRFTENGREYKIERSLIGANATTKVKLFSVNEDGSEETLAQGVKDVKKELFKLTRLDRASFINSFFAKQKETAGLLDSTPADRKTLIRKMLGFERLDALTKMIAQSIADMKAEVSLLERQVKTPEQMEEIRALIMEKKEALTVLNDRFLAAKRVVQSKTTEKAEAQKRVDELRKIEAAYNKLQKEITRLKTRLESTTASITETEAEIERLKKLKEEADALEPQVNQLAGVEESLAVQNTKKSNLQLFEATQKSLNNHQKSLNDQNVKLHELEIVIDAGSWLADALQQKRSVLSLLEESKSLLDANLSDVTREHNGNTSSLKQKADRKAKIEKLDASAPCEECERELHDHKPFLLEKYTKEIAELEILCGNTSARKAELEKQVSEKKALIKNAEDEIKDLTVKISNLERDKKDHETLLEEIASTRVKIATLETDLGLVGPHDFNQEEFDRLTNEKKRLDALSTKYNRMLGEIGMIQGKKDSLVDLVASKQKLINSLTETEASVEELDFNPDTLKAADALQKAKDKELIEAIQVQNDAQIALETQKNEIGNLERNLLDEQNRINEFESAKKEIDLHINYRDIVEAFKQRVTSESLPKISYEADELFRNITRDRYNSLQIDPESFEIIVKREDKEVPLETLSGGEKDLAAVCLRIAISRHIVSMNGAGNLGFLALDEVFGSQDEGRRGELLNALQQISDKFSQVFIVSHNQDVQEAFPNRLIISKSGHYSVIHQMMANN